MSAATAIPEVAQDLWIDTLSDEDSTSSVGDPQSRPGRFTTRPPTRVVRVRLEQHDAGASDPAWGVCFFQVGRPGGAIGEQSYVAEMRAELSQVGRAGDAMATSSPWPSLWRRPAVAQADSSRGVLAVRHEYRELFSDTVEVDLRSVPRWQPQITLTRRMLEADDE